MKLILHVVLFASLMNAAAEESVPVHFLKPPKLRIENLGERVLCHRPIRQEVPKLEIETYGTKTIVHNYGHGGSGWTLAPGCVQYLLKKFNDSVHAKKDTQIVVVGAGVMGLLTSYMLLQSGCEHITVIAEQYEDLASHKAGGFCAPTTVSGKTVDPEAQAFISSIGIDAYRFYAKIARGENKDFDAQGARFMPVYLKKEEAGRMKAYVDNKVMKPGQDVIIDFLNGKRYEDMQVFDDAIFMDTGQLMASLMQRLKGKITFEKRRVNSFDELDAQYIFNCAGLGGRLLNNDDTVTPGQGHLILLQAQNPEEIDYMIGFQAGSGTTEGGQTANRSVYMFPKHEPGAPETSVGVLGGTYIEGASEGTPNTNEFELLIERARDFFGE